MSRIERELHGAHQGLREFVQGRMRQVGPGTHGLGSPSVKSGDALEVGLENDGSPRARQPADERVQLQLVFQRLALRP